MLQNYADGKGQEKREQNRGRGEDKGRDREIQPCDHMLRPSGLCVSRGIYSAQLDVK